MGIRTIVGLSVILGLVATGCGGGGSGAAVHEPCCTAGATQCSMFETCKSGLTCYVMPGGPYQDTGICCEAAECSLTCDPADCEGGCSAGEASCPPLLTCRNVSGPNHCMP